MTLRQRLSEFSKNSLHIWVWILSLAMLSVGARNFEQGLNLDAPLYAKIALYLSESIRQGGDWFLLNGGTPDFVPFVEHTHGAFWLQSLLFLFLPAEDWVARIPGHLFYVLSLFFIYSVTKRHFSERSAVYTVFLLVLWPVFSNFHSTFYLDPGFLFFGMLFLWAYKKSLLLSSRGWKWALAGGFFLSLCFLIKGMTIFALGLPATALGCFAVYRSSKSSKVRQEFSWQLLNTILVFLMFGVGLAVYLFAIKQSSVPDFLERYWDRQFTNRFARTLSWDFFFNAKYWKQLAVDTHYLVLLLPLAFWKLKCRPIHFFLLFCVLSLSLVYTYGGRVGGQYWLLIMPPLAMLLGDLLGDKFKFDPGKLRRFSTGTALVLVCVIQYLPFPTHYSRVPSEAEKIADYSERLGVPDLVLNIPKKKRDFIFSSPFSWYGKVKVLYSEPVEMAKDELRFAMSLLADTLVYRSPTGEALDFSDSQFFMLLDFELSGEAGCLRKLKSDSGRVFELTLAKDYPNAAFYVPSDVVEQVPVRCAKKL